MDTKRYQLCLGHISHKKDECEGCKADEMNEECDVYEGIWIYPFESREVCFYFLRFEKHYFFYQFFREFPSTFVCCLNYIVSPAHYPRKPSLRAFTAS